MARPVSTHATTKFRISKAVLADLEEMHWTLRKDASQIVGRLLRRPLLTILLRMLPSLVSNF